MKPRPMKSAALFLMKFGLLLLLYSSMPIYFASQKLHPNLQFEGTNPSTFSLTPNVTPRASIIHGPIFLMGMMGPTIGAHFRIKPGVAPLVTHISSKISK